MCHHQSSVSLFSILLMLGDPSLHQDLVFKQWTTTGKRDRWGRQSLGKFNPSHTHPGVCKSIAQLSIRLRGFSYLNFQWLLAQKCVTAGVKEAVLLKSFAPQETRGFDIRLRNARESIHSHATGNRVSSITVSPFVSRPLSLECHFTYCSNRCTRRDYFANKLL